LKLSKLPEVVTFDSSILALAGAAVAPALVAAALKAPLTETRADSPRDGVKAALHFWVTAFRRCFTPHV
jgi:hypothetical protein